MDKIKILLFLCIFFGCGKTGDLNNDLNTTSLNTSSRLTKIFKELRDFELIVEDHINYNKNSKNNEPEESIENKIKDINYVKNLSSRYDDWYLIWKRLLDSDGKKLSHQELKLLKVWIELVFEKQNILNKVPSISAHSLYDYPRDSIYLFQYRNFVDDNEEL